MKIIVGKKYDPFVNPITPYKGEKTEKFYWRNMLAEYCEAKEEVCIYMEKVTEVPWEEDPRGAVDFIKWLEDKYNRIRWK